MLGEFFLVVWWSALFSLTKIFGEQGICVRLKHLTLRTHHTSTPLHWLQTESRRRRGGRRPILICCLLVQAVRIFFWLEWIVHPFRDGKEGAGYLIYYLFSVFLFTMVQEQCALYYISYFAAVKYIIVFYYFYCCFSCRCGNSLGSFANILSF